MPTKQEKITEMLPECLHCLQVFLLSVGGTTINRLCGSGLDAVMYAARAIAVGEGDIYIAGGTESMTRAPFVMAKPEVDFPRGNMELAGYNDWLAFYE